MIIRISEDIDLIDMTKPMEESEEKTAVKIEMWYDRSRREWVIYPVDEDGNQLAEARYGYGKAEAKEIKKDLEAEYGIR